MVKQILDKMCLYTYMGPQFQMLDDPVFVSITSLEMYHEQPAEFKQVLQALEEAQTGDTLIRHGAIRAIRADDVVRWRPVEYSHYFYTDIPG